MSFQEALKEGASISGNFSLNHITTEYQVKPLIKSNAEEKNRILSAKSIVSGGVSIKNTLAERYLKEHRGIEHPERLNVLFWPKGAAWKNIDDNGNIYEKVNKTPALLIPAQNENNEVTAVQRIYLDSNTGNKNTFMDNAKLSKGKIESSAGIIQKSGKFGTLYVAEGPETGASIAMANPQATVLVSFGLSNLKNLTPIIKRFQPKEVIIAADNDAHSKNKTLEMTHEAQAYYKERGIVAEVALPTNLPEAIKTDWNDVHRKMGISQVRR